MNKILKKVKVNKILILVICLMIVISSVYAYSSATNFNPRYGTLTTRTNFRTKPSTNSAVTSVLAKNTVVKMVGESGSFYIVQLGNNQVGYVSKNYVKSSNAAPKGALTYTNMQAKIATVSANNVNLRQGPGTNFKSLSKISKGTKVKIIGSISNFYMTITENNTARND